MKKGEEILTLLSSFTATCVACGEANNSQSQGHNPGLPFFFSWEVVVGEAEEGLNLHFGVEANQALRRS